MSKAKIMDKIIEKIKTKILENRKLANDLDPSDDSSGAVLHIKYGCFADGLEAALSIIEGGFDDNGVLPSIISTNVESGVCDNFELSKWNVSDHNCKHCGFNRNAHFIADER